MTFTYTSSFRPIANQPVRFGCRMLVFNSPKPKSGEAQEEQAQLIYNLTSAGGNSLLKQSTRGPLRNDLEGDQWEKAQPNEGYTDPTGIFRSDGFGLAYHQHGSHEEKAIRSNKPAWSESGYAIWANALSKLHQTLSKKMNGLNLMVHVRNMAKSAPTSSDQDMHPYILGDWMLMRHGMASPTDREALNKLHDAAMEKYGDFGLKSDSDTAKIARCLAARLVEQTGSPDIRNLKTEQVRQILQGLLQKIASAEDPSKPTSTYNIALSDTTQRGREIVVSYSGPVPSLGVQPRPMQMAIHTRKDGAQDLICALEKMQPDPKQGLLTWHTIPNNTIATFKLDKNNQWKYNPVPLLPEKK